MNSFQCECDNPYFCDFQQACDHDRTNIKGQESEAPSSEEPSAKIAIGPTDV